MPSMWILQASDGSELTFRLSPGAVKTVGRAPRADFIVDAAMVSRLHCRLTAEDHRLEVVDLDSTNGTFVNGESIQEKQLNHGDRVTIGQNSIHFSLLGA